jgi:uncharacterized protein HemX
VDHDEADHLRREVRRLRQSRARWRAVACALAVVVALCLAAGVAGGLTVAYSWKRQQEAEERERLREAEELRARQEARDLIEQWNRRLAGGEPDFEEALKRLQRFQAEARRRDALAPVAGGLAAAALEPCDD